MKKYLGAVIGYYHDVVSEMKKVAWPSPQETWDQTLVVLTVSGLLALFTFVVDWLINSFVGKLL